MIGAARVVVDGNAFVSCFVVLGLGSRHLTLGACRLPLSPFGSSQISYRMTTTFDEEKVKKGICAESDYPYSESQGSCSADMCTPVEGSIVKDHVDIVPRKTKALKEALKQKPVTAAMVASDVS